MKNIKDSYWIDRLKELGVVVIIPTYNNDQTLSAVIPDVKSYSSSIIIVNDGSTDSTSEILAKTSDIHLITYSANRGKGVALKLGFIRAKEMGFRYAITIDSDGQHFASDIPHFIDYIEQHPDSLIVGSRNIAEENMPGKNTFANRFSNFWYYVETGVKLADTQSGFRLYPLEKLSLDKWWYTAKYEYELEIIVFANWKGIAVVNVPINVYYPPKGERISHFRPLADFTRISILNTFLVIIALLLIHPRNFFRKLSWTNIKAFFDKHLLKTKDSNITITKSIMLGVLLGILPIWGYQMIVAVLLAQFLKLNKVITLIAANISIPPLTPLVLYGSYLTGALALDQSPSLKLNDFSFDAIKTVLGQYLVGSLLFSVFCSLLIGAISFVILRLTRKNIVE